MKLQEAIAKRIKNILIERNLTQYQLYKLSGIPQSTISTLLKAETQTVKLSTIYDICSGLQIELSQFFNNNLFQLNNLYD